MTMKYEDGNATQFEGESSLAIPVTQEARFEFSEIQIMPDTVAVYEEANITCNLYNLGRVKMYNVKAKFEGDAIEGEEQFIGNLESGATGTIDGIVTAVAESYDESNCKLVLTYEDDSGKEYSVEQPFTMTITSEMEPADMEMMTDIPEDYGKSGWTYRRSDCRSGGSGSCRNGCIAEEEKEKDPVVGRGGVVR